MIGNIPENHIQQLSHYILEKTGLFFPANKWHALMKGIKFAAAEHGVDIPSFIHNLLESSCDKQKLNSLIGYLTIGETYFLRDKNLFQILKDNIIRELIQQKRQKEKKINFLSAGCATGEEPYSIAILIDHLFPQLKQWEITIIGTDINANFLQKAGKGIYSRWSLRETPEQIIQKYFIQTDANNFELVAHIKNHVRFAQLNLMETNYLGSLHIYEEMDIVLCRNVIMYFDEHCRNRVVEKLVGMIARNGWLITGPAESGFVQNTGLIPVKFSNMILHQKKERTSNERSFSATPSAAKSYEKKSYFTKRPVPRKPALMHYSKNKPAALADRTKADIYQEAVKEYENGNYRASIKKLTNILSKNKSSGDSFLMEAELMTLLARSYANMGEIDEADYWCVKAIEAEKLNPEIYFLHSSIFQHAGNIKDSIRSLRQALYLDPDFIMAHFMLGLLMLQENNVSDGVKNMKNALSLLKLKDPGEILPFSEGMTVARLIETIKGMLSNKVL